jgi:3-isopropylmalate dehydrogenase
MLLKIAVLPGDGIGPEVTAQAVAVLRDVCDVYGHTVRLTEKNVGGAGLTKANDPLPPDTLEACLSVDAVFLGAVGGPAFDSVPRHLRPESGLLRLRSELGVFANLRPAVCYPGLEACSPLQEQAVRGTDLLVVRELLGGLYFGKPRSIEGETGQRVAIDTMRYAEPEIERIARMAFDLARSRRKHVTSVDKANVLDCSRLWREVVIRVGKEYPDVRLEHAYVDSAAMALVASPTLFDVILTENMFGDILSDQVGGIVGSLGILASASLGGKVGLYEPVHGSAPALAGKGIANPLGAILSGALLLRHSLGLEAESSEIESAVRRVLSAGCRTRDLARLGEVSLTTEEIGSAVRNEIKRNTGATSRSATG